MENSGQREKHRASPDGEVRFRPVTIDDSFAAVSHAFPTTAEWQGRHFLYAHRNGVTLIETKKTTFTPEGCCPACGQQRGSRDSRFFYWLLVDGRFRLVDAAVRSKLAPMKTMAQSMPSLLVALDPRSV